jgi:hypothetical protein
MTNDFGFRNVECGFNGFNDLNGFNPPASPEGEADGGQAI